jgi:hypothetical protein
LLFLGILLGVVSLASPVFAQSTLAGVVRDTTGAVLPGVTVEATSPVLIEKLRSVVTDGEGRYSIVDLRPGPYTMTFSLSGFNSVKRDGIEVAANVIVPINVELRVGALEETLTVFGQTPVVDVQSAQKVQNLTREALDTLPTNHTVAGVAQLIVGVSLVSPDVGGAHKIVDSDTSEGGPLKQNTLWFFGSLRYQKVDTPIANTISGRSTSNAFIPDPQGKQGIDDSLLVSGIARLTWQMSPRMKLAAYAQREHPDRQLRQSRRSKPADDSRRRGHVAARFL